MRRPRARGQVSAWRHKALKIRDFRRPRGWNAARAWRVHLRPPMATLACALPPAVDDELRRRGVSLDALPGEGPEQRDDRLDTALMAWFRDTGDRRAFEALYEHSRVRVASWLRWILREQQVRLDPVDLLQDTFVN